MELSEIFYNAFLGKEVGRDKLGNIFYESNNLSRYFSRSMRWVKYNGIAEPTKVDALWNAWLHHQLTEPPYRDDVGNVMRLNLTGTKYKHVPSKKSENRYIAWGK